MRSPFSSCRSFSCWGAWASVGAAPEVSSRGAGAQSLCSTWDLLRSQIEPVSLASAGRSVTTEPPGKSRLGVLGLAPARAEETAIGDQVGGRGQTGMDWLLRSQSLVSAPGPTGGWRPAAVSAPWGVSRRAPLGLCQPDLCSKAEPSAALPAHLPRQGTHSAVAWGVAVPRCPWVPGGHW